MKIVAFAASNSSKSINKQLVTYAASLVDSAEVEILNISDFELPLFGIDREVELGQPELAKKFLEKLRGADAIIISFAEHNLSYSAAYKNLFDWCSRSETKGYNDKPLLLLSASIGQHGGQTVLGTALSTIPLFGGVIKASLSIPNFNSNFDSNVGQLVDKELIRKLKKALNTLLN